MTSRNVHGNLKTAKSINDLAVFCCLERPSAVYLIRDTQIRSAKPGANRYGSSIAVAREWHATIHLAKVGEGHAARTLIRLEQDVFPRLGGLPIGEIKPQELLQTIRRVEARGAIETAHRALQACGQVFRYAIATGRAERDPTPDLRGAPKPVLVQQS